MAFLMTVAPQDFSVVQRHLLSFLAESYFTLCILSQFGTTLNGKIYTLMSSITVEPSSGMHGCLSQVVR